MEHGELSPAAKPERIDSDGFQTLYVRLRPHLEALARRYLRRPQEIEDVVQETLLRVYQAGIAADSELQALAFARRVLTNLCIDRFRSAGRRPTLISLEGTPAHQLPDEDDGTDLVLRAEDALVVREAFALLSAQHRNALVMREIEEKPLAQIAEELNVPVESVKHLLFRARRSLRRLLIGTQVEPGVDPEQADPVGHGGGHGHEAGFTTALGVLLFLVIAVTGSSIGTRASSHAGTGHHRRQIATATRPLLLGG